MSHADTRSLQQIKLETEQTRDGLSTTVEQLKTSVAETASDIRNRISPDAIKAEVSDYIRSRGEQLMNDVTGAARRNPMQAVAVGATIAYPLLRLARTIPFPVLMVGAGLFFAGSKTGQAVAQKASDMAGDLSEDMVRRAHDVRDQVQDTASAAKTYAADGLDRMSGAVADGSGQLRDAADAAGNAIRSGSRQIRDSAVSAGSDLSDQAASVKDEGRRLAGAAGATIQDAAAGASAAVRSAASTVAEAGLETARTIKTQAADVSDRASRTFFQTIEQNPMLVAGVGLLVGGLIASALPRTDFEDDLVGDTSAAAKQRVQAAASEGLNSAKTAIGEVFDEASRQANDEGLTPEDFGRAAQDIGQRVRRVAEAAVTTAFEPADDDHQPSIHGDNHHG